MTQRNRSLPRVFRALQLSQGEYIVHYTRLHYFFFVWRMFFPSVLFIGLLYYVFRGSIELSTAFGFLLVYVLWAAYHWLQWRRRFYIVTNINLRIWGGLIPRISPRDTINLQSIISYQPLLTGIHVFLALFGCNYEILEIPGFKVRLPFMPAWFETQIGAARSNPTPLVGQQQVQQNLPPMPPLE